MSVYAPVAIFDVGTRHGQKLQLPIFAEQDPLAQATSFVDTHDLPEIVIPKLVSHIVLTLNNLGIHKMHPDGDTMKNSVEHIPANNMIAGITNDELPDPAQSLSDPTESNRIAHQYAVNEIRDAKRQQLKISQLSPNLHQNRSRDIKSTGMIQQSQPHHDVVSDRARMAPFSPQGEGLEIENLTSDIDTPFVASSITISKAYR
jgi:hypothetical protein